MRRTRRFKFVPSLVVLLFLVTTPGYRLAAAQPVATPAASPDAAVTGGDWPMYRADPARTGAVSGPALAV